MKTIFYIVFSLLVPFAAMAQRLSLDMKMTLNLNLNQCLMKDVIKQIANETGISFSFTNDIFTDNTLIQYQAKNTPLETVFNDVFSKHDIAWMVYQSSVILRKEKTIRNEYQIKGQVVESSSLKPIPFASVAIIGTSSQGVICNENGSFEISVNDAQFTDSIQFSSVGFIRKRLMVKQLLQSTASTILLENKPQPIEPVIICAHDYKTETLGNDAFFPIGTLYLDTHGQQTALFIENKKDRGGEIRSLQVYLSKKGNTTAPFRVHLYAVDTNGKKPGSDLLTDALVIKPAKDGGWFTVEMSKYHVAVPENGFFVAIEGIYPSVNTEIRDSTVFWGADAEGDDFDETPSVVSYGQKIGYTKSRKGSNNTWHYSLSHTWFQLRKNNFGVMIAADIRYLKKHKSAPTN